MFNKELYTIISDLKWLKSPTVADQAAANLRLQTFLVAGRKCLPNTPNISYPCWHRQPLRPGVDYYLRSLYRFYKKLEQKDWYNACRELEVLIKLKKGSEHISLHTILCLIEESDINAQEK